MILRTLILVFVLFACSCKKQDITPPVIKLNGESYITHQLYESYQEAGASAIDDSDGDLTEKIIITNNIQAYKLGKYTVVYTATDKSGNTGIAKRTIDVIYKTENDTVVNDTTPPVITLYGPSTAFARLGSAYEDQGAYAIDNIYGDLTPFIVTENNVNSNNVGQYSVIYNVSDFSGNSASKTRAVNVVNDNTPPVITLLGPNPLTMPKNKQYLEPGATAYDAYFGDVSNRIIITGNVNTSIAGTYILTYKATDLVGNQSMKTRTVNVVNDTIPPVLTLMGPNPMQIPLYGMYNEPGATAYDDIDGNLSNMIQKTGTVNTSLAGSYQITYSVSDMSGNNSTKIRNINVGF